MQLEKLLSEAGAKISAARMMILKGENNGRCASYISDQNIMQLARVQKRGNVR